MNRNLSEAVARSARVVGIGFTISTALFAALYAVQYKNRTSVPFESPKEWTLTTKLYVHQALDQHSPEKQIKFWEKAIGSLVSKDSKIESKSAEWLAGYSDILRLLGLAQATAGQDPSDALLASKSIPYGSAYLIEKADLELYERTGDRTYLLAALQTQQKNGNLKSIDEARVPAQLGAEATDSYTQLAKTYFADGETAKALNTYLALHRALEGASDDLLCVRPSTAGMAGQMLWKLGYKDDALKWFELAVQDSAKSQTAACRRCSELASDLLRRAKEQK